MPILSFPSLSSSFLGGNVAEIKAKSLWDDHYEYVFDRGLISIFSVLAERDVFLVDLEL